MNSAMTQVERFLWSLELTGTFMAQIRSRFTYSLNDHKMAPLGLIRQEARKGR